MECPALVSLLPGLDTCACVGVVSVGGLFVGGTPQEHPSASYPVPAVIPPLSETSLLYSHQMLP